MTGTTLATDALEEIGAIAAGDSLTTADAAKALAVMNRMIVASNINRGNIYSERLDTWTLTTGTQTYTIGPSGHFDTARPLGLSRVNLLMPSGSLTVRRKIDILTTAQWQRKSVQQITGLPVEIYNDGSNPLSTYWFYQIPDRAWQVETYTWQQFAALAALTDTILVPQGYEEYWVYALALRLAAPFGRTLNPGTLALYQEAKAAVMALNAKSPRISSNGDLPAAGAGGGMYNWLSGEVEDI